MAKEVLVEVNYSNPHGMRCIYYTDNTFQEVGDDDPASGRWKEMPRGIYYLVTGSKEGVRNRSWTYDEYSEEVLIAIAERELLC